MGPHVRSTKRLTDVQLAAAARSYRRLRAAARANEEDAAIAAAAILKELEARKTIEVEVDRLRISRRSRVVRKVNLSTLALVVGRSLFARVTKPAIDTARWNAAIAAGLVKPADVAAVETETESSAWLDISEAA